MRHFTVGQVCIVINFASSSFHWFAKWWYNIEEVFFHAFYDWNEIINCIIATLKKISVMICSYSDVGRCNVHDLKFVIFSDIGDSFWICMPETGCWWSKPSVNEAWSLGKSCVISSDFGQRINQTSFCKQWFFSPFLVIAPKK